MIEQVPIPAQPSAQQKYLENQKTENGPLTGERTRR